MSTAPLGYLDSAGARADTTLPLTWFLLLLSIAVCVTIAALLWIALRRGTFRASAEPPAAARSTGGSRLILIGLGITTLFLLIALGWTMAALASVGHIPRKPEFTIDVTAHQWWWEVDYNGKSPDDRFATANEIHIPVGAKVLVRLHSGDVIHSFWVPKLSGKTDVIPGQTNLSWLEADRPGVYRGQCSEYCGMQHAHMALEVVAQGTRDFDAWRRRQLLTAPPPLTAQQSQGLRIVEYRCATCHAVRGTNAGGRVGPDLTHLMSRRTIAAGTLPTTRPALAGWVEDPQSSKLGALMPPQHLTGPELQAVLAYLETLR